MSFGLGAYEMTLLTTIGIGVTLALSLNLITGFCGQISLGHAAFYGTGAYCAALLTKSGVPFVLAVLAGGGLAAAVGIIVGLASLRVRHDFLAITTMGVSFLFVGVVRQQDVLGGEMGVSSIPDHGFGKLGFMVLALAIAVAVALFSIYLKRTWMGYAFDSIADDEDTARTVGIDVGQYKLTAFAFGTAIAGIAGGLYAHHVRFISPESFGFIESITILSMVVIGGIGSVGGIIVAAVVLTMLPQWFQFIQDYKLLLYGGLLFAMMRFSPGGLAALTGKLFNRISARRRA
jgi:branched-chain amino acid transport system permease protein